MDGCVSPWYHEGGAQQQLFLLYKYSLYRAKGVAPETTQSPPILSTNPQTSLIYLRGLVSIVKILAIRAQKSF